MALVNVLAAPAAPSGGRLAAAVVGVFALTATLLPVEAWARAAPESFAVDGRGSQALEVGGRMWVSSPGAFEAPRA